MYDESSSSARSNLLQTNEQLELELQSNINEAISIILNPADSITDYTQAEELFKKDRTGTYHDDLVALYLLTRQFSKAQAYIDSLGQRRNNSGLVSFLNLAKQSAQRNDNWPELLGNALNQEKINNLALNINTSGSAQAQAISEHYLTLDLYNFIEDFNEDCGNRLLATNTVDKTKNTQAISNGWVKVYPNPFSNQLKLNYNFETGLPYGNIQLTEAGSGRILYEGTYTGLIGEHTINTSHLITGFYILKIQ